MRSILLAIVAAMLQAALACAADVRADSVLVLKSDKKLVLFSKGAKLRQYRIALGANPQGHKRQEGDERTPEGAYILDWRKSDSAFHRAIHISYPNARDRADARQRGVSPGGNIMIHGQKNGLGWLSSVSQSFNWTDGCIAVTDREMDEIWELVPDGTPITIRP